MSEINNIIKFYRDCYQTDSKGVRIRNFLSRRCEKRFIPSNNDFFHERSSGFPVNTKWGKDVESTLFLNSKEKALYAGSIFVKGRQKTLGKESIAFTPLYIHELELNIIDEIYFVSIKDTFFNPDFLDLTNSIDPKLNLSLDVLSIEAPQNPFGYDNYTRLRNFFKKYFNSWNNDNLVKLQDPNFNYNKHYKRFIKASNEPFRLYTCLMFGVFKKSQGSLGVLSELNQLGEANFNSKLLKQLFELEVSGNKNITRRDIFLPTTLSKKQESALYTSDVFPISQIIGPPGTGKSYTISALAIDAISNNKSVLIVTRNVQASRVITNIIENTFGLKGTVTKAFNQNYKRSLIARISKAIKLDDRTVNSPKRLAKRISKIIEQIRKTENDIIQIAKSEYTWGKFYSENQEGFFSLFKHQWFKYKKESSEPIWSLNIKLRALSIEKARLVKKYIKTKLIYDLNRLVIRKRDEFISLNRALKENNLTAFDKKLNDVNFDLVLKAVPLWTSTTKEISKCLPLINGLFDMVIFDEASQCDIATAIPCMFRAKQMVVVGDPMQLRHISFLSKNREQELRQANSVSRDIPNYNNDSLIDSTNVLLTNPDQTTHLDEHFRSKTDIIQFSNDKFYGNQLKLIRSNPISDSTASLEVVFTKGKRDQTGVNSIELVCLLERVKTLIDLYTDSTDVMAPSIGISSPFADQVKELKKSLFQMIPFYLIKKHNILVGTPFHFQGEERDVMFISFCVNQESHPAVLNYLNRRDVFNVLVTRARNRQVVITSTRPSRLPIKSLLKEYLESASAATLPVIQGDIYDSFFNEVSGFLKNNGLELVKHSTVVSGVLIDLVVLNNNQCYCIDLIGYPGEFEEQLNLEELRILNRSKMPVFFLPFSNWHLDSEKTKKSLLAFINTENPSNF